MTAIVIRGDARQLPLPDASVDLIVTSPPYFGLRSYTDGGAHYAGQIGSEATPGEWVDALVACTAEWVRVLKPQGSMFINLGDKYPGKQPGDWSRDTQPLNDHGRLGVPGYKSLPLTAQNQRDAKPVSWGNARPKSLLGLPWRYALACTDQLGLILRRDIVWHKPNGLPESVTDRCRSSHEYVFHLVKQPRYYAAVDEIREPHSGGAHDQGPNATVQVSESGNGLRHRTFRSRTAEYNALGKLPGSVWSIPSQPLQVPPGLGVDHYAAFPMELPRRIIQGWSPPGVCCACGQGRRPVTARTLDIDHTARQERPGFIDGAEPFGNRRGMNAEVRPRATTVATITGYTCACLCPDCGQPAIGPDCPRPTAPTRPAVVLDPFGGTGTTALIAHALGRTGITVDLSMDYARLAKWRTTDPGERARAMEVPKPPKQLDGQGELFEELM